MELPPETENVPKKKDSKKRKKSEGGDGSVPQTKKAKVETPRESRTPKTKGSGKKKSDVSAASANLLKAFLIKKNK